MFRYDFGEKLDLTKFKKQALYYIGTSSEIRYQFYLKNYLMLADIGVHTNNSHKVKIQIKEIFRDQDKEIENNSLIYPLRDTRFSSLSNIKEIYLNDDSFAEFISNNVIFTINKIVSLLVVIHKINDLKIFI